MGFPVGVVVRESIEGSGSGEQPGRWEKGEILDRRGFHAEEKSVVFFKE